MSSSGSSSFPPTVDVGVDPSGLTLLLGDGRGVTVPWEWVPRLAAASPEQRRGWEISDDGTQVTWPGLGAAVNVRALFKQKGAAVDVRVEEASLTLLLRDGRIVTIPLWWFPRLCAANTEEHSNWETGDDGSWLLWPDLDEDIPIGVIGADGPVYESSRSLARWLLARRQGRGVTLEEIAAWHQDAPPNTSFEPALAGSRSASTRQC